MRRHACLWLVATLLLTAASALAGEVSDIDRFELWNRCRPMDLVVEPLQHDEPDIDLTKDAIEAAAQGRLRAAHIYSEDPDETAEAYLYVLVVVKSSAVSVGIAYYKVIQDLATNIWAPSVTWWVISTGVHGQDWNFIVSNVTRLTDKFIDEYLRVNEDDCE